MVTSQDLFSASLGILCRSSSCSAIFSSGTDRICSFRSFSDKSKERDRIWGTKMVERNTHNTVTTQVIAAIGQELTMVLSIQE
jgi:hypothetical protein